MPQLFCLFKTDKRSLWPHCQAYRAALDHGVVPAAMMAYREIIANGNVLVLQVFVKHVVHVGEAAVGTLVF